MLDETSEVSQVSRGIRVVSQNNQNAQLYSVQVCDNILDTLYKITGFLITLSRWMERYGQLIMTNGISHQEW